MYNTQNLSALTAEQKRELIAAAKLLEKETKAQEEEKYKAYEDLRDQMVNEFVAKARTMEALMKQYHADMTANIMTFRDLMRDFGDLRKNSQGGFSIMNNDLDCKVILHKKKIGEYNELANLAEEHIRGFLERSIKHISQDFYDIIVKLLERKKGKLEYSRVLEILSFEDKFEDEDWKKGCELLKKSFQITSSKYYFEFQAKNANGAWERIDLNFSSYGQVELIEEKQDA